MMTASPFNTATARAAGSLYRQVAVGSQIGGQVDAHHLVTMLFDGFFEAISHARGAIRCGDVTTKCKALTRAAAIVEEGLRASLNVKQGGPLARDLHDLYAYVAMRLTQANLLSNESALDECVRLMQPIAEAWASVRPRTTDA